MSGSVGVAFGDRDAELFEFAYEGFEPAVVIKERLVGGELVGGEEAGDGLAGDFAGPGVERSVQSGWIVVAGAGGFAAAAGPDDDAAGEAGAEGGELGGEMREFGLLAFGRRHRVQFLSYPRFVSGHLPQYSYCGYSGRW